MTIINTFDNIKLINPNVSMKRGNHINKSVAIVSVLMSIVFLLASCSLSSGMSYKDDIINLFIKNEDEIISAVNSRNFDNIEKINGIQSIYVSDDYIDFSCGGSGFGSSTHYYGFFYSVSDNLLAWNGGGWPANELYECGQGFKYQQTGGDNEVLCRKNW